MPPPEGESRGEPAPPPRELRIGHADADQRLDRYLRKLLSHVPLGAIFKHLRAGRIRVDGKKAKPELRLQEGMVLQLRLGTKDLQTVQQAPDRRSASPRAPASRGPRPTVVYRDDDVLVVDKPAGMAVQGSQRGGGDSLVAWLDHKAYGMRSQTFAPAPAHRLDRDTSGLVAIGLSPRGLRGLTAAFREGQAHKTYLAVVHGRPDPSEGTITAPLELIAGAQSHEPKVEVSEHGKDAVTDFETVATVGEGDATQSLVRCWPRTGRTHQIRAHLAFLGCPIVGDRRYGSPLRRGRFLLHAEQLVLPHPVRDKQLELRAEAGAEFEVGE